MNSLPEGKKYFRKIVKLFDDRLKMLESDKLDWAMGELLAYATLLDEGNSIRISGQDVERGTFSHRHAVLKSEDSEEARRTIAVGSYSDMFFGCLLGWILGIFAFCCLFMNLGGRRPPEDSKMAYMLGFCSKSSFL